MAKVGVKPQPFEHYLSIALDASGCINWIGVTSRSNGSEAHRYGRYTLDGKKILAHRQAYQLAFGTIPPGMLVLHSCDNTRCCNPAHLFIGTQKDNVQDAIRKGRMKPKANGIASGLSRRSKK